MTAGPEVHWGLRGSPAKHSLAMQLSDDGLPLATPHALRRMHPQQLPTQSAVEHKLIDQVELHHFKAISCWRHVVYCDSTFMLSEMRTRTSEAPVGYCSWEQPLV